jgi:hypothetical protein
MGKGWLELKRYWFFYNFFYGGELDYSVVEGQKFRCLYTFSRGEDEAKRDSKFIFSECFHD